MSLFNDAKSRLNIKNVMEHYGMRFDRNNKCLCPFHNDKHPSLCLVEHKQIFKCHVCGTGGDFIIFVAKFFGVSNFEALKKINCDFGLGLSLEKSKKQVFSPYKAKKLEKERLEKWCKKTLCKTIQSYKDCEELIKNEEIYTENWCKLNKEIEYWDYLTNELINCDTKEEMLKYKKGVDKR